MDSCKIWSLVLSVKASFNFQRGIPLMLPNLIPKENHLVNYMLKVSQILGFYVAIVRLNNVKHVSQRHFILVKLVNSLRNVKVKSNFHIY